MVTVLDSPRNSSGPARTKLSTGPLNLPKLSGPQTRQDDDTFWEDGVTEYPASGAVVSDDALPDVNPLPWRQCAVLMVLASVAVYGLGYAVVTAFNHLFQFLQL